MNLQTIKALDGKDEYVLLPMSIYRRLRDEIDELLDDSSSDEYVPFELEDYVQNPAALARIKANLTQRELAERMDVTQAYISKIEKSDSVTPKTLKKIVSACDQGMSSSV